MDLRHLRYFLCVADEMHFGRAALRLGISQPPLSQQIRALEEELGVRLFDRNSRRVRLTEAGRLFLPEAEKTLRQADRAAQTAREAHRGDIGHLRLGFTTSAPFVPSVAGALYRFRQCYPRVDLQLNELAREEQIARIEHRELEMGIIRSAARPALSPGLVSHCLLEEHMVLAMRDDHPLALREALPDIVDLIDVPLILYGPVTGAGVNDNLFELCAEAGFVPTVAYEANGLGTLLGLVAAGFGATMLAQSLGRLHVDNLVYRPLATPVNTSLWLVHGEDLPPTGEAFKKTLLDAGFDPASAPVMAPSAA